MREKFRSVYMAQSIASATCKAIAQTGLGGLPTPSQLGLVTGALCAPQGWLNSSRFLPRLNPVAHPHPHVFLSQRPFSRTASQSRTLMR